MTLGSLNEEALVKILKEPRNALVKQYKKLLEMDGVELEFEEEALVEIAKQAKERNTGARGLRGIVENLMTNIMFEVPSRDDVRKCVITKEVVLDTKKQPLLLGEGQELLA